MENFLPADHMHDLIKKQIPKMRFDGSMTFDEWKKAAREKLSELLGIDEIEPYRCDPQFNVEFDEKHEDEGYREIRFTFFSEVNVRVPCHLFVPLNVTKPLPVVIGLQGHSRGMHISLRRVRWEGDAEDFLNGDRDFVYRAAKEGVCGIALEQRAFGECGGTETGPKCQMPGCRALLLGRTLQGERVWDIMRLIDVIENEFAEYIDAEKIICLGNSGGGSATVYASALEDRIKISVPSCAVSTYEASIGAMDHCICNYIPGVAKYFDMGELCAMNAPGCLVVVSGKDDPIFPLEGAKKCFADAKAVYETLGIGEKATHVIGNGGHRFYADDAWPVIHKYLEMI